MKEELGKDIKRFFEDLKKGRIKKQIPNLLTASRLLSPFILIPLIYLDKKILSLIMIVIFVLTDTLDGFIARKTNNISVLGKYLDAFSDKTFVLSLLIPLILKSMYHLSNPNLIILSIILELVIGFTNLAFFLKDIKTYTTIYGKIKTIFLFSLLAILYLNRFVDINNIIILGLTVITIILQVITYISYFIQIKKNKELNQY